MFGAHTELTEVSGNRYQVRTEPYRSIREGIEAVLNITEDFGRVFTEKIPLVYFGTYYTLPRTPSQLSHFTYQSGR